MISKNRTAKEDILSSIRKNLSASAPFDAVHREHKHDGLSKGATLEQKAGGFDKTVSSLIEEFRTNLEAVDGKCTLVRDFENVPATVQSIIDDVAPRRIALTDSKIVHETFGEVVTSAEVLENASAHELFSCDVGITGAQWAIAETGTLVLESEKEFARLTSLVPDIHVCLLDASNVRQTMAEILEILRQDLDPTVTFITGPSRTSDIELTLAIGVHGPRELHVIVIG
jgi:L-lactate dehydrogenase complex protein LldG